MKDDFIVAALTLAVFSFMGLFLYLPVVFAIFKIWKESKVHFHLLLLALAFSDNCQLVLYLAYAVPSTLLEKNIYGPDLDALLFGTLSNVLYFTGLASLVNIGLNRYWSVCRKHTYKATYTKRVIFLSIAACYAFGVISAVPQLAPCCPLRYWYDEYSFGYDMSPYAPYVWYDRTVTTTTFVSGAIIYVSIFLRIRKARAVGFHSSSSIQTADQRRDQMNKRLAIQSALVFGMMFLAGLGFTCIPLFTDNKWFSMVSALLMINAYGVQPIIYLSFNGSIRTKIRQFFPCFKNTSISDNVVTHPLAGTTSNHKWGQ